MLLISLHFGFFSFFFSFFEKAKLAAFLRTSDALSAWEHSTYNTHAFASVQCVCVCERTIDY